MCAFNKDFLIFGTEFLQITSFRKQKKDRQIDRYIDKSIDKTKQTDTWAEPDRLTSVGPCHSWYSPVPEGTRSDYPDTLQPPHEVVSLPSQSYAQDHESVASCGPIHGWGSGGRVEGDVEGEVEGGGERILLHNL